MPKLAYTLTKYPYSSCVSFSCPSFTLLSNSVVAAVALNLMLDSRLLDDVIGDFFSVASDGHVALSDKLSQVVDSALNKKDDHVLVFTDFEHTKVSW